MNIYEDLFNEDGSVKDEVILAGAQHLASDEPAVTKGTYVLDGVSAEDGYPEDFAGKCLLIVSGTTQPLDTTYVLFANSIIWYKSAKSATWEKDAGYTASEKEQYDSIMGTVEQLRNDISNLKVSVNNTIQTKIDGMLDGKGRLKWDVMPEVIQHNRGVYVTVEEILNNVTNPVAGDWVINTTTDTVWIYDAETSKWVDSDRKGQVTSVNGKTGAVEIDELTFTCAATTSTRYEDINLSVITQSDSDNIARSYKPFKNIKSGTSDGHGLAIQSSGAMVVGSGESPSIYLNGDTTVTGQKEQLYLTSDNNIYIETNLDRGYAYKKDFILGSSGNTWINQYLVLRNPNVKKGTNPSGNVYANIAFQDNSQSASVDASVRTGLVENRMDSSGNVRTYLGAYQFSGTTAFASIGVHYSADGTTYGFCPTPPAASDNTCIATTAWVRDRITISTADPSGGTSGDIWIKY